MPAPNPYQSPESPSPPSLRSGICSFLWSWRAFTSTITVCLGLCTVYFFYQNHRLRSLHPNLEDPTPGRDGYWPQVAYLLNSTIGIGLAVIGIIVALCTIFWSRKKSGPHY